MKANLINIAIILLGACTILQGLEYKVSSLVVIGGSMLSVAGVIRLVRGNLSRAHLEDEK